MPMKNETLQSVVSTFGTPCYVYDEGLINRNVARFKSIPYSSKSIHFASMANDNPELLNLLCQSGFGIFVNSIKHLSVALDSGFLNDEIIYTTTGIRLDDLKLLCDHKIQVNLDSLKQIESYGAINRGGRIGVRLNVDEKSRLNVYTGIESRIGIIESEFPTLFDIASRYGIKIVGTHVYLGTDITSIEDMIRGARRTLELSDHFPDLEYVDLGGGFPLTHIDKPSFDYAQYGKLITEIFNEYSQSRGRDIRLILEPGRALFGDTGVFCSKVLEIKERPDRVLISCDASVSIFPRPMIYSEFHDIYVLGKENDPPFSKQSDVVGSTTYSRDYLGKGLSLPRVEEGDVLVFRDSGSYCYSMMTRFLGQTMPNEVLVDRHGNARLIRDREMIDIVPRLKNGAPGARTNFAGRTDETAIASGMMGTATRLAPSAQAAAVEVRIGTVTGIDSEAGIGISSDSIPSAASNAMAVKSLYDGQLPAGDAVRELVFPHVFGEGQYVSQYSDNSADDIRRMAQRAAMTQGTSVLDVGIGGAGPATFLASEYEVHITGVDLSQRHLQAARKRIGHLGLENRIELIEGDIYRVAGELGPFDVVMGLGAWCHLDAKEFFPLCRKLLKPGGRIAFMERVQLGQLENDLLIDLTLGWACPTIESFASYFKALNNAGFTNIFIEDLTGGYLELQKRFVQARLDLREQIISIAGEEYFKSDLRLVEAECRATEEGRLGYGMFVATAAG